jgi:ectoine hydroxylase-related dioxygenase (phytanoyl-CoA dioxygenase family)
MHIVDYSLVKLFEKNGFVVVPEILTKSMVEQLRCELVIAIEEDRLSYPAVFDSGMIHNCMIRGEQMLKLLDLQVLNTYLEVFFSATCIVYAYQSSSLPPHQGNYGSRIHVDSPRFIPNYMTNLGVIFPLDDFTVDNGATYYLEGSHFTEELPSEEDFYANAKRMLCPQGSMILFNSRLVHAAGVNKTTSSRHALTINLCRSYMRQRFDFPRLVPDNLINQLGANGQRLLGMNVRMPSCIEDFYLPEEHRLYKPGQG